MVLENILFHTRVPDNQLGVVEDSNHRRLYDLELLREVEDCDRVGMLVLLVQCTDLVEVGTHSILLFLGVGNLLRMLVVESDTPRVNTGEIDFEVSLTAVVLTVLNNLHDILLKQGVRLDNTHRQLPVVDIVMAGVTLLVAVLESTVFHQELLVVMADEMRQSYILHG